MSAICLTIYFLSCEPHKTCTTLYRSCSTMWFLILVGKEVYIRTYNPILLTYLKAHIPWSPEKWSFGHLWLWFPESYCTQAPQDDTPKLKKIVVTSNHFVEPLVLSVWDFGWLCPWKARVDPSLPALYSHLYIMILRVNSELSGLSLVPILHLGMMRLEWPPNVTSRMAGRFKPTSSCPKAHCSTNRALVSQLLACREGFYLPRIAENTRF